MTLLNLQRQKQNGLEIYPDRSYLRSLPPPPKKNSQCYE